jgi:hypothetical protein
MNPPPAADESRRTITVELHARSGELAGTGSIHLTVAQDATAADVKRALASRVPALGALLSSSALATEHEYLSDGAPIGPGSAFHLVPPVSGG